MRSKKDGPARRDVRIEHPVATGCESAQSPTIDSAQHIDHDSAFGLLGWESLGPQPLWRKTRCSALQRRSSSLTTPSLLSRDSPHPARAGCSHRRIMVDVLGRIDGWWKRSSTEV